MSEPNKNNQEPNFEEFFRMPPYDREKLEKMTQQERWEYNTGYFNVGAISILLGALFFLFVLILGISAFPSIALFVVGVAAILYWFDPFMLPDIFQSISKFINEKLGGSK